MPLDQVADEGWRRDDLPERKQIGRSPAESDEWLTHLANASHAGRFTARPVTSLATCHEGAPHGDLRGILADTRQQNS